MATEIKKIFANFATDAVEDFPKPGAEHSYKEPFKL